MNVLFWPEGAFSKSQRSPDRKSIAQHGKSSFQLLSRAVQETPKTKSLLLLCGALGCSPVREGKLLFMKKLFT